MRITYSRTAHVLNCGAEMVDLLINNLNGGTAEDGSFTASWESLTSWVDEYEENCDLTYERIGSFLTEVREKLEGEIGDIVFCKG